MSFTTGDVDIKIKNIRIENEKNVTPKDIVNEASEIYKKMKKADYRITDYERADEFTAKMRSEHKEFAQSYPIVLRYICQMQEYSAKALQKYLTAIAVKPWKSKVEYIESQCDYVVTLYKEKHPRWHVKDIANLRANISKLLKTEDEKFTEIAEKTQKEVDRDDEEYKKKRKNELINFYRKYGTETSLMNLRVESNVEGGDTIVLTGCNESTESTGCNESSETKKYSITADDLLS